MQLGRSFVFVHDGCLQVDPVAGDVRCPGEEDAQAPGSYFFFMSTTQMEASLCLLPSRTIAIQDDVERSRSASNEFPIEYARWRYFNHRPAP
jgi:hypothetical protein